VYISVSLNRVRVRLHNS